MIAANCSGLVKRLCVMIVALSSLRIEPDAHRVGRREHLHLADAGHTAQFVNDAAIGEVAEIERGSLAALRLQANNQQEARIGLSDRNALSAHLLGKPLLDTAQPILHLHLRFIDVRAGTEGDIDRRGAIGKAGRRHVEEALNAVQLLLDDLRDVLLEHRGIGAG